MDYMNKIKKMLCKELEEYGEKNSISAADVEMIHKLTDTIKNIDKIGMLEDEDGYSEHYPMYDEDRGSSYARRGTHYARGHYSRDDGRGYSNGYAERYDRGYDRNYSKDEAKDRMMSKLGSMMDGADPKEREILKHAMRKLEEV